MQTWDKTCSLAEHKVGSHVVSEPDASSPAAFVVPGGQVVQTWDKTCSLAEHEVGSHVVSEPDDCSDINHDDDDDDDDDDERNPGVFPAIYFECQRY